MTRRRPHARRPRSGFTLIESLATIAVLAAVATVASSLILVATDGYLEANTAAQLHAEGSIALDRLVREFRSIPLDAGAGGIAPDIDTVTPSSMQWNAGYALSLTGTNLVFNTQTSSSEVLLADVSAFTIRTYDESNSQLASNLSGAACDPIRRIELTVTLTRYGASETLRTRVFVRSTMEGA